MARGREPTGCSTGETGGLPPASAPRHPPLSAVFWKLAEPLFAPGDELTLKNARAVLLLTSAIWDAVILEQVQDDTSALDRLREGAFEMGVPASHELLDVIDSCRQRKLTQYADDHRLTVSLEVTEREHEFHLRVESNDLDEE